MDFLPQIPRCTRNDTLRLDFWIEKADFIIVPNTLDAGLNPFKQRS